MKCPSCKHELKKIFYEHTEQNQCLNCGGLWFDGGNFDNIKNQEDGFLRWLDVDLFSDPQRFMGGYSTMICPKDQQSLYEISYDNADIKVDVCNVCKGIWLDKDEYEQIIAFLKKMVFRENVAQYVKHLEKEIKEIFTGPEDLISELKDVYVVFRLLENRIVSQWPRIEEIIVSLRTALLK